MIIGPGLDAFAQESDVIITDAVSVSTGLMNYTQTGVDPKTGSNTSNVTAEWAHFAKRDMSPFVGYRIAFDAERSRTLYQAGFAGIRYYYLGLGTPLRAYRSASTIKYNFTWRPYLDMGTVFGRYLVDTLFNDAADFSSDFMGVSVGTGLVYAIGQNYGIDTKMIYEYVDGYGPLDFGASTILVLLGMKYYL